MFTKLLKNYFSGQISSNNTRKRRSSSALKPGRMRIARTINDSPEQPGVYRMVNKVTGIVDYVGQTNNIKRRIGEHKRSGNLDLVIHNIVYGIAKADATRDALCFTEKQHIKKHRPKKNKTQGGNGRR